MLLLVTAPKTSGCVSEHGRSIPLAVIERDELCLWGHRIAGVSAPSHAVFTWAPLRNPPVFKLSANGVCEKLAVFGGSQT